MGPQSKHIERGNDHGHVQQHQLRAIRPRPGLWSGLFVWPFVAVHANLMYTGRVLAWDGQEFGNDAEGLGSGHQRSSRMCRAADNIFCAGHVQLADGRVLVVGGHVAALTSGFRTQTSSIRPRNRGVLRRPCNIRGGIRPSTQAARWARSGHVRRNELQSLLRYGARDLQSDDRTPGHLEQCAACRCRTTRTCSSCRTAG